MSAADAACPTSAAVLVRMCSTSAVAVLCATVGGRYLYIAYGSLGLGAAAKLVPALATAPLALARRRAVRGYAVFFGVLALLFAPALLLGRVEGIVFQYGAFEVRGPGVRLASSLTLPLTAALLLITALVIYREHRLGRLGTDLFPRYAAALILAFMLGSKVLSPQYLIWLLPLVPLGAGGVAGLGVSALFLAACWTTTQVFPIHYGDLLNLRSPGPELLLARNLLLVLLWACLLFLPGESPEKEAA
jgi:hypothetical protein